MHIRSTRHLTVLVLALAATFAQAGLRGQEPQVPRDYSQEPVVFEQIRTRARFEDDGTGEREAYVRVRVQSEAGVQQLGQLRFGYNSGVERATVAFVRVRKPDGTIVSTPTESVQDLTAAVQRIAPVYTDFREKHVEVQGLRPGDVLEYQVGTRVEKPLAPGHFWTEYAFETEPVVLDEQFDLDIPSSRTVILRLAPGFEATPRAADGRLVYHWTRAQLETARDRKAAEKDADATTPSGSTADAPVAPIRLTTFRDWAEVGRWYSALELPQRVPTPEIRQKAAELVAGRASDLDKVEALYDFVSTGFRYVSLSLGVGRYQPRAAPAVLEEQYGDCKDKHTLLASLIEASGLPVSGALIGTSRTLDPSFPSPSQFDHIVTVARVDGQDVWMDTTSEVAPFRLLLATLRNKQALLLDPEGPRLVTTPADPPMRTLVTQLLRGAIDKDGGLQGHVTITTRGDLELLLRTAFRVLPESRWSELVEEAIQVRDKSVTSSHMRISDPAALHDPFTFEFDVAMPRYADLSQPRAAVLLPLAAPAARVPLGDGPDPVALGASPSEYSYRIEVTLPPGIQVQAPIPVTLSRDFGDYVASYSVDDGVLHAERTLTTTVAEVPAARRQEVGAFFTVVTTDAAQQLTFVNAASTGAPRSSDGLTAAQLGASGAEAVNAGRYKEAVGLLRRAVELDPKDKSAWNNLGRAHLGLRQAAEAIDAFEKQIAVNPYDQYAYNNLGRAYAGKRQYDKAETAFLKQLEVNPLDRYVPANLGNLYLELRRYDEAIVQLEKALAINPDDATLQYRAGKAYMNVGQTEKATAAFDRAVALVPTPTTWNNVAYELSLHGVQLDRAQQYAEAAVATATAASRMIDVTRGDTTSLAIVRSLATFWDTLGWVMVARGDITGGTPYVEMAWRLGQHGEVGDHLGQIYEKTGQKEKAIETYALALGVSDPVPESRTRLVALVGASRAEALVDEKRSLLAAQRTVAVEGRVPERMTADVLLVVSAPGTVDAVRFLSGPEALRPVADAIPRARWARMFPDDGPARLLRRGLLACAPSGGCAVTLLLPDDAQPVQ